MNRMAKEDIDPREALRKLPPLVKGYVRAGSFIGDGAVIDNQFGTTDVLIYFPVAHIDQRWRSKFRPRLAKFPQFRHPMRAVTFRLSAIQAANGLLGGAYLPFFSVSLAARGMPAATIGLLLALATLLRIAIAPLAGLVADARDDRWSVMLVFTFFSVIGFVALAFVQNGAAIFWSATGAIVLWSATSPILESVTLRAAEHEGLSLRAGACVALHCFRGGEYCFGLCGGAFRSWNRCALARHFCDPAIGRNSCAAG